MFRFLTCLAFLAAAAGAQAPAIPDTPAGRALRSWLEALNSGDRKQLEAHVRQYSPDKIDIVDRSIEMRDQTGGFDLVAITTSEPRRIDFQLKERASDPHASGEVVRKDDVPART